MSIGSPSFRTLGRRLGCCPREKTAVQRTERRVQDSGRHPDRAKSKSRGKPAVSPPAVGDRSAEPVARFLVYICAKERHDDERQGYPAINRFAAGRHDGGHARVDVTSAGARFPALETDEGSGGRRERVSESTGRGRSDPPIVAAHGIRRARAAAPGKESWVRCST